MPIECSEALAPINQEDFHRIDRNVMGLAFAIHNSMGRFFDENIYQSELATACLRLGIEARREVEIRVTHGDFSKPYFLDILLGGGCVYELKNTASLDRAHDRQLIHYLLLAGLNHGKLINFRPASVESRFISTRLKPEDRMDFTMDTRHWQRNGTNLKECLCALMEDWGTFLEADLYRQALVHMTSKAGGGLQPVPIMSEGRILGHQQFNLLNPDCAWHLSAVHENLPSYETHIKRMLTHTPLKALQWININQRSICLKTLSR